MAASQVILMMNAASMMMPFRAYWSTNGVAARFSFSRPLGLSPLLRSVTNLVAAAPV
jgi:hypothetical protein